MQIAIQAALILVLCAGIAWSQQCTCTCNPITTTDDKDVGVSARIQQIEKNFFTLEDKVSVLKEILENSTNLPERESTTSMPAGCKDATTTTPAVELSRGSYKHPVNSCRELPEDYPSGDYFVVNNTNSSINTPIKVYCDMNRTACNITSGWSRIAMLDMTNPNHTCPGDLRLITNVENPKRLCASTVPASGCHSVVFKTNGIRYSRIHGRIKGYQLGGQYAFYYHSNGIERSYLDGISLTHGNPGMRKHIWSFATGAGSKAAYDCPCTTGSQAPDFVGDNYFCDTANHNYSNWEDALSIPFYEDPLWEGNDCTPNTNCYCLNSPPYFCTELPEPTNDDIELRLCTNYISLSHGASYIEVVDLYVR